MRMSGVVRTKKGGEVLSLRHLPLIPLHSYFVLSLWYNENIMCGVSPFLSARER